MGMRERERATATTGAAGTDGWTEVLRVDKKRLLTSWGMIIECVVVVVEVVELRRREHGSPY